MHQVSWRMLRFSPGVNVLFILDTLLPQPHHKVGQPCNKSRKNNNKHKNKKERNKEGARWHEQPDQTSVLTPLP